MRFLVAILALLTACTLRVHVPDHTPKKLALVEAAGAELGLEIEHRNRPARGVVTLDIVEHCQPDHCGRAVRAGQCYWVAWAEDSLHVVTHELGHTVGLGHVSDDDNVMATASRKGSTLTDEQREKAQLSTMITGCR